MSMTLSMNGPLIHQASRSKNGLQPDVNQKRQLCLSVDVRSQCKSALTGTYGHSIVLLQTHKIGIIANFGSISCRLDSVFH